MKLSVKEAKDITDRVCAMVNLALQKGYTSTDKRTVINEDWPEYKPLKGRAFFGPSGTKPNYYIDDDQKQNGTGIQFVMAIAPNGEIEIFYKKNLGAPDEKTYVIRADLDMPDEVCKRMMGDLAGFEGICQKMAELPFIKAHNELKVSQQTTSSTTAPPPPATQSPSSIILPSAPSNSTTTSTTPSNNLSSPAYLEVYKFQ